MCGIITGMAILAIIFVSVFLDKIVLDKEEGKSRRVSLRLLVATFSQLFKNHSQKLLVPLTIYSGVEQGFIGGTYTRVSPGADLRPDADVAFNKIC